MKRAGRWAGLVVALWLPACGPADRAPVYQDDQGFRLTPPPGWVERARPDAVPGGSAQVGRRGRRGQAVPLPPLGVAAQPDQGRLLARYDRLTAGRLAWLRLSAVDIPSSTPLAACLSAPAGDWRRESDVEEVEVGGLPAARAAFVGRWEDQDYVNETVAVRKEERVILITASFPAADDAAREQVRRAVAGATWK
jgi:hypothetical protein